MGRVQSHKVLEYDKIVKDIFKPKANQKKEQEMQTMISKLSHKPRDR